MLPHAERVLAALKDAADALAGLRSGDAGPVSLAAVGTLAGPGLTRVLKHFSARFPKADLSLRTATSAEVSDLVRRGEAAIGLRYLDDPSPDLDRRALRPEPMKVVCAPNHTLAGKRVRSLRDLKSERWLAFPRNEGREAATADVFAQFVVRGVAEINWFGVDSLTAQKRLIEAGYGIALLPESNIGEELRSRSLAIITVRDLDVANPVVAITRRAGYLSPASRVLLDLLESDFDGDSRHGRALRRAERSR